MTGSLTAADWWQLFVHFLTLSLLAVGGAITTAGDMHRFLVLQQRWLEEAQFTAAIALAQAAPGPNILFVALMGWYVGLNHAGNATAAQAWITGLLGAGITLGAMLLPSSLVTYGIARWLQRHRSWWPVQAFRLGMAPVVIGLLLATGWVLARGNAATGATLHDVPLWALAGVVAVLVWRTRLHLLWLLAAGAALGALGAV